MSHIHTFRFAFLFCALGLMVLFSASCGSNEKADSSPPPPTPEQLLVKSWKLRKLNIQNEVAPPQIMANSSFNFYSNGRYEILMGDLDRGTWKLSADKKILITMPDNGGENRIDLLKITATELILSNNQGPNPVRMELAPE